MLHRPYDTGPTSQGSLPSITWVPPSDKQSPMFSRFPLELESSLMINEPWNRAGKSTFSIFNRMQYLGNQPWQINRSWKTWMYTAYASDPTPLQLNRQK